MTDKSKGLKATDLRIGNWILNGPIPTIVFGIEKEINSYKDPDGAWYNLDQCYPIKLTNDLLLKCGAIPKYGNHYNIGRYLFSVNTIGIVRFHVSGKVVYLDYLHELQNLFFGLTKTELEIHL